MKLFNDFGVMRAGLILAGIVLLTACGGGSDNSTTSPTTTPESPKLTWDEGKWDSSTWQ